MDVLFGIQYHAADFFIVPPGSVAFSRMTTFAPCAAAFSAAGNPAAPAPTTTTSNVSSQLTSLARAGFRPAPITDLRVSLRRAASAATRFSAAGACAVNQLVQARLTSWPVDCARVPDRIARIRPSRKGGD